MKILWPLKRKVLKTSCEALLAGAALKAVLEAAGRATTRKAEEMTAGSEDTASRLRSRPALESAITTGSSELSLRSRSQGVVQSFHLFPLSLRYFMQNICREVCVGLCYLNKLNLSQGLPGVLWKRGPGWMNASSDDTAWVSQASNTHCWINHIYCLMSLWGVLPWLSDESGIISIFQIGPKSKHYIALSLSHETLFTPAYLTFSSNQGGGYICPPPPPPCY